MGKGAGTELCSFGMRQVELEPVQGHLHCRFGCWMQLSTQERTK